MEGCRKARAIGAGPMYATDRQTSDSIIAECPRLGVRGHNNSCNVTIFLSGGASPPIAPKICQQGSLRHSLCLPQNRFIRVEQ